MVELDPVDRQLGEIHGGDDALAWFEPSGPATARDRILTLLRIYELHTAPLDRIGDRVRLQHHPTVAVLKGSSKRRGSQHADGDTATPSASWSAARTASGVWLVSVADFGLVLSPRWARFVASVLTVDAGSDLLNKLYEAR